MAFDTEGTFYGSYPLDAEGNYKHNVWGGEYAYETNVTQEDGSEAAATVDEVENLIKLISGRKGDVPAGVGIRIDQVKYLHIKSMKSEKFSVTPPGAEEEQEITIDDTHVLRAGSKGALVMVRGGYMFICLHDASDPKQQVPGASEAICGVSYWCSGADPE
ncbi:unnamed protein product [Symbiodinium sp. KB8]|nr:unnamed protein product [Symbiodinium sp. KB8]